MIGGKGREASAAEASGEGNEDLQQKQTVRPDVDERKDDESLSFNSMVALRLFGEIYAKTK